jgi:hypothetical protein
MQKGGVVYPPQQEQKDGRSPALLQPDVPSNGQQLSKGGVIYLPQQQQQQYQDPASGYKPGEGGYGGYRSDVPPPQEQYNSYSRQQVPSDAQYREQQYQGAGDYYSRQQEPSGMAQEELPYQKQQQQHQEIPGPEPRPPQQEPSEQDEYRQYYEHRQYKQYPDQLPYPGNAGWFVALPRNWLARGLGWAFMCSSLKEIFQDRPFMFVCSCCSCTLHACSCLWLSLMGGGADITTHGHCRFDECVLSCLPNPWHEHRRCPKVLSPGAASRGLPAHS